MAAWAEHNFTHRQVSVNGISMHVVEKGSGPVVLLLHGFPELWYSWRHQIAGLATRGYRAVAPDLRGFGDTDAPEDVGLYTIPHLVGDLVALIETLGEDQVFVVGHDWGAILAWYLCLFRPDKVKALVNLSVPHPSFDRSVRIIDYYHKLCGDDHYMVRFQEPGVIEAFFAERGTEFVMKKILQKRDPGPLLISKLFDTSGGFEVTIPTWLTQDDVDYYVSKLEKTGFRGGVNYYRCLNLDWELVAPWDTARVLVPTIFALGDLDLTYNYPGVRDYLHKGGFKKMVPQLEEVVVMPGVAHHIQQEKPEEIMNLIYRFINKF